MANDIRTGSPREGEDLPWLDTPTSGAYEEEPLVSRQVLLAGLAGFLALLLVVIGGVYWFMTRDPAEPQSETIVASGEAELIRAPEAPFKIRPDDQGGFSVPDQDKTALAEAGGQTPDLSGTVGSTAEEPLPPPLPEPGPEPMTTPPVATPTPKPPVATPTPKPPVATPTPKPPAATPTPKPPVVAAAPQPTPKPPVAKPPVAATPKPAPPAASGGGYVLQLGAFSSRERAMAGWADYQARYGALGGLAADVQSVQSGGKTLFRLRAASLSSEQAAAAKCAEVKSQGLACIVAKR